MGQSYTVLVQVLATYSPHLVQFRSIFPYFVTILDFSISLFFQDLNVDQRNKLIGQLPKDTAQPLANLNKCLDKVQDFLTSNEDSPPCDISLKKTDRKKDRQVVFNHRQNLMQQIENCSDPALTLHLAVLILFQCQTDLATDFFLVTCLRVH